MEPPPVQTLRRRRARIRARWAELLRAEAAPSPLAHPDTLVHLLDTTLDALLAAVRRPAARPPRLARPPATTPCAASCRCGLNPLLAYFAAGERALLEAAGPAAPDGAGDAALALCRALRRLARGELETFCSLCQHPHALRWARAHASGPSARAGACRPASRPPSSPPATPASSHENRPRPR